MLKVIQLVWSWNLNPNYKAHILNYHAIFMLHLNLRKKNQICHHLHLPDFSTLIVMRREGRQLKHIH